MPSITLSREVLKDELSLPSEAIHDEIYDTSRWSEHHDIVFEYEGKFYQTSYSIGATEMQYETPWQDEKEVECWEVVEKEVTKKAWVRVED